MVRGVLEVSGNSEMANYINTATINRSNNDQTFDKMNSSLLHSRRMTHRQTDV